MTWWDKALVGVAVVFGVMAVLSTLGGAYRDAGDWGLLTFVTLGTWMVLEIVFNDDDWPGV